MSWKFMSYAICFPRGTFEREVRNRGMKLVYFRSLIRYNYRHTQFTKSLAVDCYTETCITSQGSISRAFRNNPGRIMDPEADIQYDWWVKTPEDFIPLCTYLRDGLETPSTSLVEKIEEEAKDLGDDGVIITGVEFSPLITAIHMLGLVGWSESMLNAPKEYGIFLDTLQFYNDKQWAAAARLEKPWVIMASQINDNISPELYRKEVIPCFEFLGPPLRSRGHVIGLHAHAKYLSRYLPIISAMQPGWIESFTPSPFADLTLKELRQLVGKDVFLWVNIPEVIFYMGNDYIKEWTQRLLDQDPEGNNAIGFSEMGMMGVTQWTTRPLFQNGLRLVMDVVERHNTHA